MKKSNKIFYKSALSFVLIFSLFASTLTAFPTSAAGNMAFSVGCDYNYDEGNPDIDTSSDAISSCDYYALAGYISRYTGNPSVSKITASYNGTKLMESDIVMLSGHGEYDHLYFRSKGQLGEYWFNITNGVVNYYNAIPLLTFDMSKIKLIMFNSCSGAKTAGTTGSDPCLAIQAFYYGAGASLGWTVDIGEECASLWLGRFNNCIALGYTIQAAINYANSFTYPGNCTCMYNYTLYGNGSQVLKRNTRTNTQIALEPTIVKTPNITLSANKLYDKTTIKNIIQKEYPDFWFKDFTINVTDNDNGNSIITVVEKIGEFSTQNAYILFYENGKITNVFDRTVKKPSSSEYNTLLLSSANSNKQEALTLASQKISNDLSVKNQTATLMYDVETGEKYYHIYTYATNGQSTFKGVSYKHPIT